MDSIIQDISEFYNYTESLADPRTKGWFLVDSPWPTFWGMVLYLMTVWLGPAAMKNLPALKLRELLIPYNLAMALLNFYIVWQTMDGMIALQYNLLCEPCRQVFTHYEMQIVSALWWYYFSKLIEFCDTFFFILRKKNNQLSFLHVYHHVTMFGFWWLTIKWMPSGSIAIPACMNAMIHVLMYTYYGLAAIGPQMNKYLWWKKYLTIIQLIQFFGAVFFGTLALFIECDYPMWMKLIFCGYMFSFLILFGRFYASAYLADRKKKKLQEEFTKVATEDIDENKNITNMNGH